MSSVLAVIEESTKQIYSFLFNWILDFLFPPEVDLRQILKMSPCQIYQRSWQEWTDKQNIENKKPADRWLLSSFVFYCLPFGSATTSLAIKTLKFGRKNSTSTIILGQKLSQILFDCSLEYLSDFCLYYNLAANELIFSPCPISAQRLKQRGFNQSQTIIEMADKTSQEILIKIKDTQKQAKLKAAERQNNLNDCFKISNSTPSGRNKCVVLIDDVFTTGATLTEASGTLLAALDSTLHVCRVLPMALAHEI